MKDSAVFIVMNRNPIFKLVPSDIGKDMQIRGKVSKGSHSLGFCAAGSPNEAPHQVEIENLTISQDP